MSRPTTKITIIGLYTALCVAAGYLLAPIPNVELITLFVFLGGYFFGIFHGLLIGSTAMFIYSAFNWWGSGLAFPPLIISQVLSYGFTGLCGGIISRVIPHFTSQRVTIFIFAVSGAMLTSIYYIAVTLVTAEFTGLSIKHFAVLFIPGLPFALLNIGLNVVFFAALAPRLIRIADQFLFKLKFE